MQTVYWGFPVTQELYTRLDSIISQTRAAQGADKQLNKALSDAVYELVKEGLQAYYHGPTQLLPMNPSKQKAFDSGVKVITGAIKLVIGKFFGSLDPQRLLAVANYVDDLLHAPAGAEPARLMFALEPALQQRVSFSLQQVCDQDVTEQDIQDLIKAMQQIVQVSIRHYYEQPADLVSLGRITRSVTDLAIRNVQKAFDSFLEKMLSKLDHENVTKLSDYLGSMLHEPAEKRRQAVG